MIYNGPLIDVDVHHKWRRDDELLAYLPSRWRTHVEQGGMQLLTPEYAASTAGPSGTNKRLDSFPQTGGPPGSDYGLMRDQLLDPLNVSHAVLCFDIGLQAGVTNPYLATALCQAANDWSVDRWLDGRDARLHGAALVAPERPLEAAEEIRRMAGHPQIAEVLLVANMMGKPFGHPAYDPIHAAAAECGLPIGIHLGADLFPSGSGRIAAGGHPQSRLEIFTLFEQGGMHHASSLLTHGVFERYPGLRVILKEYGFAWVPWLLWRLDSQFAQLRSENPAVTRLPSETFREHVLVTTQPFVYTDDANQLLELLEAFGGMGDLLTFSTDYPHWDYDDPLRIASKLPESWHANVFHDNAARFLGLPTLSSSPSGSTTPGASDAKGGTSPTP